MNSRHQDENGLPTRREILKRMALAPGVFYPAHFLGWPHGPGFPNLLADRPRHFPFWDFRLTPRYPVKSPLTDILSLVVPGSDGYITERYSDEIESILKRWSEALKASPDNHSVLVEALDPSIEASTWKAARESEARAAYGIRTVRRQFAAELVSGREQFAENIRAWLGTPARIETASFEIYGIEEIGSSPLAVRAEIRHDLVCSLNGERKEERVGSWRTEWVNHGGETWKARKWEAGEESIATVNTPAFVDVTSQALGGTESYRPQMLHGADYWRTILDGAIGTDVYCNNGVACGDFDKDGFEDIYVCQSAGLPNRLYRNRGDGTFEDVTEKAGVGVLDSSACALFADFRNCGLQDLLVVCGTGPLLFVNRGDGTFSLERNAFKFAHPPQGTFTHAALADYDGDGRLDIYFCTYMYYLGLEQYHYPIPYYDARNGPPNCLLRNQGDGTFVETTEHAGLKVNNDRYSFACAWGDSNGNGLPDLFVANDFGSSQLYRNNGDGTFTDVSKDAHVESVGAGMSCCWADYDNDGRQDVYVASMWEAAGQRVAEQAQFHQKAPAGIRGKYQRHARGNALYRNRGDGTFENRGSEAGVEMGRWSWCSDFWDIDDDGYADLYVANGYLSGPDRYDLASFFWRQVVAKSPESSTPDPAYERGWNAINELVRSDHTWHGFARNVLFVNNRDGTFTEASGPLGLDFIEDSRCFALADIDHDGRLEVILKNRNAPQVRILHNAMQQVGNSISIRLLGRKSNRDGIGAAVTVEAQGLRQTKYMQAGSGFLAQHSKELHFGLGSRQAGIRATVRWPDGQTQSFDELPVNHRIVLEEGSATIDAKPFAAPLALYARAGPAPVAERLPDSVATWLIEPLKAPEFSLPDADGTMRTLASFQGSSALLNFWSVSVPGSLDQLRSLRPLGGESHGSAIVPLAVNLDNGEEAAAARVWATKERLPFPVLFATEEVAGIYNITYRYLFDRRRDLPIPLSLLLDGEGMIVRAYQGAIAVDRMLSDLKSIPSNAGERFRAALPFPGQLVQDTFQRNDFTYGVAMFQHGYLDQAEAAFLQAIAAKPEDAVAYYNLGTLKLHQNDLKEASRYLEESVRLNANYPEAWNNLGMAAAQQNLTDEAIRDFQKSIAQRPDYATALLNLGNLYRRQQDFANAQKCIEQAVEIQPDDPEANYSAGMLYAQQNDFEQAQLYLERAIELRPDYAEALNNLGVLFVHGQEYSQAEEQFKAGIRVAPSFDQPYLNLARLYILEKEQDKAKEVLLELLRVQPSDAAARQALEMLQ